MKSPVKLYRRPELRSPRLVIGWPDAGYVGVTVVDYLRDRLGAEEFCEIEPYEFSLTPQILVKESVIEALEFPRSVFYSWENKLSPNDLIIFRGAQPASRAYEFANLVLDVAQQFEVKRIYTVGGMFTGIVHTEKPRVLAVVNKPELKGFLKDFEVEAGLNYHGPPTMNGLTLGLGQERGIEGVLMVAEIPFYVARLPYPMSKYPRSSQAMLKVLVEMLAIEIDLGEMEKIVKNTEEQTGKLYEQLYEEVRREIGGIVYPGAEPFGEPEAPTSESARRRIEQLFRQAETDRSKAFELQRELHRLGLFEEYQDRFFDLFRGGQ